MPAASGPRGGVKVAVVGVGNCASSLVQGLARYGRSNDAVGLMRPSLGGYGVGDVRVVAAWDVDRRKVGRDVADAIFAPRTAPPCSARIRLEGTQFGGVPVSIEVRLSVEDSPNSAGVAIDLVRCAKLARDRGLAGPVEAPAAFFCKHPPRQMTDEAAHAAVEAFVAGAGGEG